jgi:hypothetical protein
MLVQEGIIDMIRQFTWALVLLGIFVLAYVSGVSADSAGTPPLRILLVDPGHTETGDYCAAAVAENPGAIVKRVDLSQIDETRGSKWDAAIWVRPQPDLYKGESARFWNEVTGQRLTGLMVIGMPRDDSARKAVLQAVAARGAPNQGAHFGSQFTGCKWIWGADTPRADSHVYLRREFNLSRNAAKAWLQICVDNNARVWLNGTEIGVTGGWQQPMTVDVTASLRSGKNVLAVDAYNIDGFAGALFSITALDDAGQKFVDIVSDNTTRSSIEPSEGWMAIGFDDGGWKPATEFAMYGEGPWARNVIEDNRTRELQVGVVSGHPAVAGLTGRFGRAVVTDAVAEGPETKVILSAGVIPVASAGAGDGGRLVIITSDAERAEIDPQNPDLLNANGFGDVINQSAMWLAGRESSLTLEGLTIPPSAAGGGSLKLFGQLKGPASGAAEIEYSVRDDARVILSKVMQCAPSQAITIDVPLPQSWEVTGDLRCRVVVRQDGRVDAVRAGTIQLVDRVAFTLSTTDSRWVFRSDEQLAFQIGLPTGQTEIDRFEASIQTTAANGSKLVARRLVDDPAKGGTLGLKDLPLGEYILRVQCLDVSQKIVGEKRLPICIVDGAKEGESFPLVIELSPLPDEGVDLKSVILRSRPVLRRLVDEVVSHGFTSLYTPTNLSPASLRYVEEYAQSRGMTINYTSWGGVEQFGRESPPAISCYSPKYAELIGEKIEKVKPAMSSYARLSHAFLFQDEPFHQGLNSFATDDCTKQQFRKQHGYDLPTDFVSAQRNPTQWLDLLNFQSRLFTEGWREVYRQVKKANPDAQLVMNHDSHNTFGGGVGQEAQIAIDDVYYWGGDFADVISSDIYPYMMTDFRYGPNRTLMKPRMAQTHFAMAQIRNVCVAFDRKMGFYFDCFNSKWFPDITETRRQQKWLEREMAFTAIANGADIAFTAAGLPEDRQHWEDLGAGLRTIQKVGTALSRSRKPRAAAAFLFPRTQYLQLQQEYWNVAQSYEFFLQSLGELDVIHEEQLTPENLNQYQMLVLCDVELLPEVAATQVENFVKQGGVVVSDCVPRMGADRSALTAMSRLFGVSNPQGGRIIWPLTGEPKQKTSMDRLRGKAMGVALDLPVLSPRKSEPASGSVELEAVSGIPGLTIHRTGKGSTYLLGFCLQDTLFQSYQSEDLQTRTQLSQLISAIAQESKLQFHIKCSNPDVEAAVRTGEREGFVFVIAHEPTSPAAVVSLSQLPFAVGRVVDVATEKPIEFHSADGTITINVNAPTGTTLLYQLLPTEGLQR